MSKTEKSQKGGSKAQENMKPDFQKHGVIQLLAELEFLLTPRRHRPLFVGRRSE